MRGVVRVGPFSRLRPVVKRAARKRTVPVASYHCQIKIISRSDGRSATAAAAYRAGERIVCDREGRTYDYTRKAGVEDAFIRAPASAPGWALDREQLWNAAEAAENRRNSRVAREWEIALPHELDADQRRELADGYAQALVERYGAAVDVCIHAPHRSGDQRNYHAHILVTTRKIGPDGFGAKTRVLDDKKTGPREVEATRALWADMQNDRLSRADVDARVDHRSLEEQRTDAMARDDNHAAAALDRPAEKHMGPEVSTIERRAQKRAEHQGREYEPVTERGQQIHVVRQIRTLLDRLLAMRNALGDRVLQAKDALNRLRGAHADNQQPNDRNSKKDHSMSEDYDRSNRTLETGKEGPWGAGDLERGKQKMVELYQERATEAAKNSADEVGRNRTAEGMAASIRRSDGLSKEKERTSASEKARKGRISRQGSKNQARRTENASAQQKAGKNREGARASSKINREFAPPTMEPLPPGIAELKQEQAREKLRQIGQEQKKDRPDKLRDRGKDWER